MAVLWKIHLFGGLRVVRVAPLVSEPAPAAVGESPLAVIERFRTQKTATLLAYLAYYPQSHAREVLSELLWPDGDPSAGAQNLRTSLSSLRRQLEPPGVPPGAVLAATRTSIQLNPQVVTTDVHEFQQACSQARSAPKGSEEKIALLERAVGLYTGPLLPGFYDDWVSGAARQLEEEYFVLLQELLAYLELAGDLSRALQFARRGAQHDDSRLELQKALRRLSEATGLNYEADEPEESKSRRRPQRKKKPATDPAIAESNHNPLTADPFGGGVLLPNIVKGKSAPGGGGSTPQRRASDKVSFNLAPVVLPAILDRFFGREEEISRVCQILEARQTRLLTLTGSGGSGKTRLAIEASHQFVNARWQHEQAVFYVPLADLQDGQLIVGSILDSLRLPRASPLLSGVSPEAVPFDRLLAVLNARPTLLVLDNFEHLTHTGAPLVQTLLERVPSLQLLVTSQQRLNIPGGQEIQVAGLPFPDEEKSQVVSPQELLELAAVQLFVERAQTVAPDFQLTRYNVSAVADICRCLEGVPLPLELAAARVNAFAPAQIAARLVDTQKRFTVLTSTRRAATPRHTSLHTAISWSYNLLPPDLARTWTKLSIFRGGFTLEAVEAVCKEPGVAHQLGQLRSNSLLAVSERDGALRFRLPELLREYASEKLHEIVHDPTILDAVHLSHARYYNDLLATYSSSLRTGMEADSLARANAETDNGRRALEWAANHPLPEHKVRGASLALSLGMCLQRRGLHAEALQLIEKGLSLLKIAPQAPEHLHIALLREHASLSLDLLEWENARASATELLKICQKRKEPAGIAAATNLLGLAAKGRNSWQEAREYFTRALGLFEADNDKVGIANVNNNLGLIEYLDTSGNKTAAIKHLHVALRLRRAMDDRRGVAETHLNLGALAQQCGSSARARRHYLIALSIETELAHSFGVGRALCNLGEVAEEQGEIVLALYLYVAARALFEETGVAYQKYTIERLSQLSKEVDLPLDEIHREARRLVRLGALEELEKWPTGEPPMNNTE